MDGVKEYIFPVYDVDADEFKEYIGFIRTKPELIRCKDCKYYVIAWLKKDGTENKRHKPSTCIFGAYEKPRDPDYYCADAEPKR